MALGRSECSEAAQAAGQQARRVVELPVGAVEPRSVMMCGFLPWRSAAAPASPTGAGTPPTPKTPPKASNRKCSEDSLSACTPSTACTDSTPRFVEPPEELRCCRFCLESEESPFEEEADTTAENRTDLFVQPCPCRGSSKFVHLECLVQCFLAMGNWHNFRCPTCKQPYEGRALRELAELSRDRMIKDHGPQAPQVAHSLCYLAQAHAQLGNVQICKEVLERGLAISEAHFGIGHVATAATLAELATAYGKLGNVQAQKELLERSLEIKEKHFGPGHINTAVTLNNLATAYSELGNVQHEKDLLERSLEIKEKHYGKGHVQTTAALVNLAGVYSELGDVTKGLNLLEWSLNIEERHFGEGHVETAITLNNLALACGEGGNVQRMKELLRQCLSIKERHFGLQHQELCLTLANLGMACAALGQEEEALANCRRALRVCAEHAHSRRFGVVLLRAAAVHTALGEETRASQLAANAVSILRDALGGGASKRVLALEGTRMGRIWVAVGRGGVAKRLQELLDQGSPDDWSDVDSMDSKDSMLLAAL